MTAYIILPKWIVRAIRAERARHLPRETGGFLIGTRRGPHIEVTGMTEQGRGDKATRISFERRCASHRQRVHAAWRRSGGVESLVGDWHSHPHGSADASSIDQSAWRAMVQSSQRAIIGLVDAGADLPNLYFADDHPPSGGIRLPLEEEAPDHLAYAVPPRLTLAPPRS